MANGRLFKFKVLMEARAILRSEGFSATGDRRFGVSLSQAVAYGSRILAARGELDGDSVRLELGTEPDSLDAALYLIDFAAGTALGKHR